MMNIRKFVKGKDEQVWIRIGNEAFKEHDDFRPDTMEDMEIWEKDPGFDPLGMFIAELGGKPVGRVQALVDKQRKDKKGFVRALGVTPEYRRKGIARKLVFKALENLKEREMEAAQCWTREDSTACKTLYASTGFNLIRVFSTMRRDLATIPTAKKNEDVKIRAIKKDGADNELLRWLLNETFSEHFNHRPATSDEWNHWFKHPDFDPLGWFIANLDDEPIGFVGTWIDSKFVKYKGIKRGWIDTIGVLKPHRRKDIGTSLILRGMEYLKLKGMTEVELGVDDSNPTTAIMLYEKVGFQIIRKDLTYQKSLTE